MTYRPSSNNWKVVIKPGLQLLQPYFFTLNISRKT